MTEEEYTDVDIQVTLGNVLSTGVPGLIKGHAGYVSIVDLFNLLLVKVDSAADFSQVNGFFLEEGRRYSIRLRDSLITVGGNTYHLPPSSAVLLDDRLYLRTDVIDSAFQVRCAFSFRDLEVRLGMDAGFPIVRQLKREQLYQNLHHTVSVETYDRAVPRSPSLVQGAMLDWSAAVRSRGNAMHYVYGLNPAFQFLGGDAQLGYSGILGSSAGAPLTWNWRYADDDFPLVHQISISRGATFPHLPPKLTAPFNVQISNHVSTPPTSFGEYVISDTTQPGWTVELWVNEGLYGVVQADYLGKYRFSVPLLFGKTDIRVRYIGPNGEERAREKHIEIPFTFQTPGHIEYLLTGAYMTSPITAPAAYGTASVGLSDAATLTAGASSLFVPDSSLILPFASLSLRPIDRMLVSVDYVHLLEYRASLAYTLPFSSSLTFNWSSRLYNSRVGQAAGDAMNVSLETPLDFLRGSLMLTGMRVGDASGHTGTVRGLVTCNLEGYATSADLAPSFSKDGVIKTVSSQLSVGSPYYLGRLAVHASAQLDLLRQSLIGISTELAIKVGESQIVSLSLGYSPEVRVASARASFALALPFAAVTLGAEKSNLNSLGIDVSAAGTIGVDDRSPALYTRPGSWSHTGGLTFRPFLDLNNNGVKDAGEPAVGHLDVQISGGQIVGNGADSATHIAGLEPFRRYFVSVTGTGFENVAWRPRYKSYGIVVEPNQFLEMPVPIFVAGEASGTVEKRRGGKSTGVAGALVRFVSDDSSYTDSTYTFQDGSFDYLGLPPGRYLAFVDPNQVGKIGVPVFGRDALHFTVKTSTEGDAVENLNFLFDVPERKR